jgi:hypothetical protein
MSPAVVVNVKLRPRSRVGRRAGTAGPSGRRARYGSIGSRACHRRRRRGGGRHEPLSRTARPGRSRRARDAGGLPGGSADVETHAVSRGRRRTHCRHADRPVGAAGEYALIARRVNQSAGAGLVLGMAIRALAGGGCRIRDLPLTFAMGRRGNRVLIVAIPLLASARERSLERLRAWWRALTLA